MTLLDPQKLRPRPIDIIVMTQQVDRSFRFRIIILFNVIPKFLNRRTVEKEVFNVIYYIINALQYELICPAVTVVPLVSDW